jgi:hypothetical protein
VPEIEFNKSDLKSLTDYLNFAAVLNYLFSYICLTYKFYNASPMFTGKGPFIINPDLFTGCNNTENTDEKA